MQIGEREREREMRKCTLLRLQAEKEKHAEGKREMNVSERDKVCNLNVDLITVTKSFR